MNIILFNVSILFIIIFTITIFLHFFNSKSYYTLWFKEKNVSNTITRLILNPCLILHKIRNVACSHKLCLQYSNDYLCKYVSYVNLLHIQKALLWNIRTVKNITYFIKRLKPWNQKAKTPYNITYAPLSQLQWHMIIVKLHHSLHFVTLIFPHFHPL